MAPNLDADTRRALYRSMLRVRRVEECIAEHYAEQEMRCPTHFSLGQEAVAAGVCAHLDPADYVISAHRSHAHYLCKGGDLKAMMAELYGKETGCAGGKGGSMHLIDLDVNFLGCVPIVGSTIPIGVGASFGATLQDRPALTVVFIGDGAVETGVFHESINYANVHKLPVVFVCENNLYSVNTTLAPRQPEGRKITDLARGHGVEAVTGDGQQIEEVFAIAGEMIGKARVGKGPVFMEFMTYRWMEHCGPRYDVDLGFRSKQEAEAWLARCPVKLHREKLLADGVMTEADFERVLAEINAEFDEALTFAKESPFPARDALTANVFAS